MNKKDGWAKKYPCCLECHTTDIPHVAKGLCEKCYARTHSRKWRKEHSDYKKTNKKYYHQHKEYFKNYLKKWKEKYPNYFKSYLKRWRDKQRFGGKRESVFKRDHYKCRFCGATEDLAIHHIDNCGRTLEKYKIYKGFNNRLDNLITVCRSCHTKLHWYEHRKGELQKRREGQHQAKGKGTAF